jgi:hypothetical protein
VGQSELAKKKLSTLERNMRQLKNDLSAAGIKIPPPPEDKGTAFKITSRARAPPAVPGAGARSKPYDGKRIGAGQTGQLKKHTFSTSLGNPKAHRATSLSALSDDHFAERIQMFSEDPRFEAAYVQSQEQVQEQEQEGSHALVKQYGS